MHFDWTDSQRAFRQRISDFLAENLPANWEELAHHGPGSEEQTHFSREFCGKLADDGPADPALAEGDGAARALDAWYQTILAEEMWMAGEPRGGQYMNVNWIGPTLMRYGSPEQQARYLPPIARGDAIWCQGFSEPDAGSDLASLRTARCATATTTAINGQKIWTSYAGLADTCFLLARTSADRKKGIIHPPGADGHAGHHGAPDPQPDRRGRHPRGVLRRCRRAGRRAARRGRRGLGDRRLLAHQRAARHSALCAGAHGARPGGRPAARRRRVRQRGRPASRRPRAAALCEAARLSSYAIVDRSAPRRASIGAGGQLGALRDGDGRAQRSPNSSSNICPRRWSTGDPYAARRTTSAAIVAGIASGAAEIQLNIDRDRRAQAAEGAALMDLALSPTRTRSSMRSMAWPSPMPARRSTTAASRWSATSSTASWSKAASSTSRSMPDLGPVTAALIVERLARLPYAVEAAASALVRPLIGWRAAAADLPRRGRARCSTRPLPRSPVRPWSLLRQGSRDQLHRERRRRCEPASNRSLPIRWALLRLSEADLAAAATARRCRRTQLRTRWRVALAAEIVGPAAGGASTSTVHLCHRAQAIRPAARAFQALRHRLAEASVRADGVHWLALKAAGTRRCRRCRAGGAITRRRPRTAIGL